MFEKSDRISAIQSIKHGVSFQLVDNKIIQWRGGEEYQTQLTFFKSCTDQTK